MKQSEALKILKTGVCVFLTGEPGSGKTFVINEYVRYLKKAKVEVAVTASTGIAATHLGGMTIHSWSGIGIKKSLSNWDLDHIASNKRVVGRMKRTKVLVIDEISMLDGKILECVDQVCREIKQNAKPFGGMQTVFVGDFFQLPPVAKEGEPVAEFAFTSKTWTQTRPYICYLSEQHRQEDKTYLEILSSLRRNEVREDHCTVLNNRCHPDKESFLKNITKLFSHNEDVDRINSAELKRIHGEEQVFIMTCSGRNSIVEQLKRGCLSPEKLLLKRGASVMFTKNSPKREFVNGTLGTVMGFDELTNYPIVKTRYGRNIIAEPMDWTIEERNRVLCRISQIPLRLAWAITIHKSQGMSLDAAFIDLKNTFVEGQGYVALSRVRTLTGLYLSGWNEMALKVHPEVFSHDKEFRSLSAETQETFNKISSEEISHMQRNFMKACGGKIVSSYSAHDSIVNKKQDISPSDKTYSVEKIREKYSNAYRSWSKEDDEKLTEQYHLGKNIKELSKFLGRQIGGIRSRLIKLGFIEDDYMSGKK